MQEEVVRTVFMYSTLLTVAGLGFGFAMQWLKLKAQQRALGTSNRELELKVERLEQANAEYAQRFENLEAIVVSQTWNALPEPRLSEVDRHRPVVGSRQEPHAPAGEDINRQRVADLAHRLG